MAWFPFVAKAEVPSSIADEFDDVEFSIRVASSRVRSELKTARFALAADGGPADEAVRDAIRDATIAQLRFWADTGDESGAAAQGGGGSILSVSLPGGGAGPDARAKQESRVAPAVAEILRGCPELDWTVVY